MKTNSLHPQKIIKALNFMKPNKNPPRNKQDPTAAIIFHYRIWCLPSFVFPLSSPTPLFLRRSISSSIKLDRSQPLAVSIEIFRTSELSPPWNRRTIPSVKTVEKTRKQNTPTFFLLSFRRTGAKVKLSAKDDTLSSKENSCLSHSLSWENSRPTFPARLHPPLFSQTLVRCTG